NGTENRRAVGFPTPQEGGASTPLAAALRSPQPVAVSGQAPRPPLRPAPAASALACRRQTCGTRAGRNSAAGRRGRRRSAYEAPRAAADGRTRLGGAESKRRRRLRLPAPPSRITLLGLGRHEQKRRRLSGHRPFWLSPSAEPPTSS